MAKKSGQINFRVDDETQTILEAIEEKHGIAQTTLGKHLLMQVAAFYKNHGWFSLPVTVTPEKFQNQEAASASTPHITSRLSSKPPAKLAQRKS